MCTWSCWRASHGRESLGEMSTLDSYIGAPKLAQSLPLGGFATQIFFKMCSPRKLGFHDPIWLPHFFFQMGWGKNHQLVKGSFLAELLYTNWLIGCAIFWPLQFPTSFLFYQFNNERHGRHTDTIDIPLFQFVLYLQLVVFFDKLWWPFLADSNRPKVFDDAHPG